MTSSWRTKTRSDRLAKRNARGNPAAGCRAPGNMKPIADFLTDYTDAEAGETSPARAARIAQLAGAVERARTDLDDAIAAWSAAVTEQAGVRRAGRLLRELGYDVPPPPQPPVEPESEQPAETSNAAAQKVKKT